MKYNFKVGQIAYINYSKKRLIIPVKVIEQIVRKTEHQEIVDWSLVTPDQTQILCSELSDPIFSNLEDSKEALMKSAATAINKMADVCMDVQNKSWPQNLSQVNTHVKDLKNLDKIKITLSDGTLANVSIPDIETTQDDQEE
jgi:hypothetical protein